MLVLLAVGSVCGQEICTNGLDDDNDGLIDLNDVVDCPCTGVLGGGEVTSIIPNPSFEVLADCCPGYWSEMECAQDWEQATEATSDLFHTCDFFPGFVPVPLPDGEACVGTVFINSSHEYVGGCLLSAMNAGEPYSLQFDVAGGLIDPVEYVLGPVVAPTTELVLYGSASCATFPIQTFECPLGEGDWQVLASIPYQLQGTWETYQMDFTPSFDVLAVMIGSPCTMPEEYEADFLDRAPYVFWDRLILNESEQFSSAVTVTGSLCTDDLELHTRTAPTGGAYQWFAEGVALVGRTDTVLDLSANGLGAGTYQLQLTIDGACAIATITIPPSAPVQPSLTVSDTVGCVPLEVLLESATVPGAGSCSWDFGDGTSATGCLVQHTYTGPGYYDVTLTVLSPEGCPFDTTYVGLVHALAGPVAGFTYAPQPLAPGSGTAQMVSTSSGAVSWNWDFGELVPPASDLESPVVEVPQVPGAYPVQLIVANDLGCVDTVQGVIVVEVGRDLSMPNVFSPNGDGRNDLFLPLTDQRVDGVLHIYNRWGQEVHRSANVANGWNGRIDGVDAPEGTYFWSLEGIHPTDSGTRSGHLLLVR